MSTKNIKDLVTIVITVHQRQKYLKRLLTYYEDFDCKKIIVDSSNNRYPSLDDFSNVEYYHNPGVGWYENVYEGLKHVKTEFVLQLADDDFALKNGIIKCVEFLSLNPDYAAAYGRRIWFSNAGSFDGAVIEKLRHIVLKDQINRNFCSDSAVSRIKYFFMAGISPAHSCLRTKIWIMYCEMIFENPHLRPAHYADRLILLLAIIHGNFKVFPFVHLLKGLDSRMIDCKNFPKDLEGDVEMITIVERLRKNNDPVSKILAENSELTLQESQKFIYKIYEDLQGGLVIGQRRSLLKKIISGLFLIGYKVFQMYVKFLTSFMPHYFHIFIPSARIRMSLEFMKRSAYNWPFLKLGEIMPDIENDMYEINYILKLVKLSASEKEFYSKNLRL